MCTFPAQMPEQFIRSIRPAGGLKPNITYTIADGYIFVDRDGGTWISPKAELYPGARNIGGHVSAMSDEDHALTLLDLKEKSTVFTVKPWTVEQMKRRGYLPVSAIRESNEPQEGEYDA